MCVYLGLYNGYTWSYPFKQGECYLTILKNSFAGCKLAFLNLLQYIGSTCATIICSIEQVFQELTLGLCKSVPPIRGTYISMSFDTLNIYIVSQPWFGSTHLHLRWRSIHIHHIPKECLAVAIAVSLFCPTKVSQYELPWLGSLLQLRPLQDKSRWFTSVFRPHCAGQRTGARVHKKQNDYDCPRRRH